jgi:hypothetical protein
MTITLRFLAIALCASASLTPAWGQQPQQVVGTCTVVNGTSQCSFPQVLVGTDPSDATKTWVTTFRLFNSTSSAKSATLETVTESKVRGGRTPVLLSDAEPAVSRPIPVRPAPTTVSVTASLDASGVWCGLPPAPQTSIAVPMTIILQTTVSSDGSPDVIGEAFVEQKDADGNVRQSYFVGDIPLGNVPRTAFSAVVTVGDRVDTAAILSNPSSLPVVTTVTIWNGTAEVATTMATIPANATTSWTVGMLFSSSPAYQSFVTGLNGSVASARMTITSPSSFAGGVTQVNMNPDKTALSAMGFLFF